MIFQKRSILSVVLLVSLFSFVVDAKKIKVRKPEVSLKGNTIEIKMQIVRHQEAKFGYANETISHQRNICGNTSSEFVDEIKDEKNKNRLTYISSDCSEETRGDTFNSHPVGERYESELFLKFKAVGFSKEIESVIKKLEIADHIDHQSSEYDFNNSKFNILDFYNDVLPKYELACIKWKLELRERFGQALVHAICVPPIFRAFSSGRPTIHGQYGVAFYDDALTE